MADDVLFVLGLSPVCEDLQFRVSRALAGSSARQMLTEFDGQELRLPFEKARDPDPAHLRWHQKQVFHGEV